MTSESNATTATDTKGAADYIRHKVGISLSPRTMERHRRHGVGPRFLKIAGQVAYRYQDLDAHIDSCLIDPCESEGSRQNESVGGGA